jgi:hypothetical protein
MQAKTGYRVLWFTSVKACINTIMVHTGWKNPGHFKFTPKAGVSADEAAVSGVLAVSDNDNASGSADHEKGEDKATEKAAKAKAGYDLSKVHKALSKVCTAITITITIILVFQYHMEQSVISCVVASTIRTFVFSG